MRAVSAEVVDKEIGDGMTYLSQVVAIESVPRMKTAFSGAINITLNNQRRDIRRASFSARVKSLLRNWLRRSS